MKGYIKKKRHWYVLAPSDTGRNQSWLCELLD